MRVVVLGAKKLLMKMFSTIYHRAAMDLAIDTMVVRILSLLPVVNSLRWSRK